MISRRTFIKTAALGTTCFALPVKAIQSRKQTKGYFGVHPFIENHPEAVFIMKTGVDHKMNAEAKLREGLSFSRSVFVPMYENGVPLNISIPVKPNLKTANNPEQYPLEDIIGTTADPYFVEGVFEGLKELGITGDQIHMRETNRVSVLHLYGYDDMAKRVGADLRLDMETKTIDQLAPGRDYNWTEVPNGVVFTKIPHLEPINAPDTWMLNIAKFKAHYMGMTLCCKNLQGTTVYNYQRFCHPFGMPDIFPDNQYENAEEIIKSSYERHLKENRIPRWDRPGQVFNLGKMYPQFPQFKGVFVEFAGGLCQETWVSRTLDNIAVTPCGLHIVEGLYGRDGNASVGGPHPTDQNHEYGLIGDSKTGRSKDFMTNIVIFSKDPIRADSIGHWLGGHEPGNFGFFHLALERRMSTVLDPFDIPVYLWNNGEAILTPLYEFNRTPLLCFYLRKDYNGGNEPPYHLVDEPFEYGMVSGTEKLVRPTKPEVVVLYQSLANPSNPFASIEYRLPISGFVKLELFNARGEVIDVPVEGYRIAGIHMANWNTAEHEAGKYSYSLRMNGHEVKGELVLVR